MESCLWFWITTSPKEIQTECWGWKNDDDIFLGILLVDYKIKEENIIRAYYANILVWKKHRKLIRGALLLQDDSPVHKAFVFVASMTSSGFEKIIHPP